MFTITDFETVEKMVFPKAIESDLIQFESFEPELFTDEDPPTLRDLTEEKKGAPSGKRHH